MKAWVVIGLLLLAGCGDGAPAVEQTQSPIASSPIAPLTLTGVGPKVTDKFTLPPGAYKIAWQASGDSTNFVVYVHQGADRKMSINEVPPKPASGESEYDSAGGPTYLEIDAGNLSWTITITTI